MQQQYFRRAQAAKFITDTWGIPCSPAYLAKLAVTGGGPPFRKISRFTVYAKADLVAWVESRSTGLLTSTSSQPRRKGFQDAGRPFADMASEQETQ